MMAGGCSVYLVRTLMLLLLSLATIPTVLGDDGRRVSNVPLTSSRALRGTVSSADQWSKENLDYKSIRERIPVDRQQHDRTQDANNVDDRTTPASSTKGNPHEQQQQQHSNRRMKKLLPSPPDVSTLLFRKYLLDYVESILDSAATAFPDIEQRRSMPYRVFAPTKWALFKMEPLYLQQLMKPEFDLHLKSLAGFHLTAYSGPLGLSNQTDTTTSNTSTSSTTTATSAPTTTSVIPMTFGGSVLLSQCYRTTSTMTTNTTSDATTLADACLLSFNSAPSRIVGEPQELQLENSNNPYNYTKAELVSIDAVLLPEWTTFNLMSYMRAFDDRVLVRYSTFISLWVASGLEPLLRNGQRITVLAPDNAGISIVTSNFLLQPSNDRILRSVLSFHVLSQLFNFLSAETQDPATNGTESNATRADNTNSTSPMPYQNQTSAARSNVNQTAPSQTPPRQVTVKTFGGHDMNVLYSESKVLFHGAPAISLALTKTSLLYHIEHLLIPPSLVGIVPVPLPSSSSNGNGNGNSGSADSDNADADSVHDDFASAADTFLATAAPLHTSQYDGSFDEIPVRPVQESDEQVFIPPLTR